MISWAGRTASTDTTTQTTGTADGRLKVCHHHLQSNHLRPRSSSVSLSPPLPVSLSFALHPPLTVYVVERQKVDLFLRGCSSAHPAKIACLRASAHVSVGEDTYGDETEHMCYCRLLQVNLWRGGVVASSFFWIPKLNIQQRFASSFSSNVSFDCETSSCGSILILYLALVIWHLSKMSFSSDMDETDDGRWVCFFYLKMKNEPQWKRVMNVLLHAMKLFLLFFKYMGPKTSASLRLVTKLILKACVWLILLQEVAAWASIWLRLIDKLIYQLNRLADTYLSFYY